MDVQNEAVYILSAKQRLGETKHCWIIGFEKLFHATATLLGAVLGAKTLTQDRCDLSDAFTRLSELVAPEMEAVNQAIRQRMQSEHAPRIPELSAHLIEAGGKRLRPILTLAAANMFGYQGDHQIRLAAAVEFIHTATLLHDDVVDESAKRRGRPTANILWDNQSSVLVGDYLFSRSFQLMVETGSLRVLDILANASAVIAEGEVLQLSSQNDLSGGEDRYFQVIRGKTAELFSAAAEVGGVIAGATDAEVKALRAYGDALGIAFQLVDDVLDYGGASAAMGKDVGDDFREGKATLPVLIAYAKADEAGRVFWERVIEDHEQEDADLEEALSLIDAADGLEETKARARQYGQDAKDALAVLPQTPVTHALGDVVDFVISRAY